VTGSTHCAPRYGAEWTEFEQTDEFRDSLVAQTTTLLLSTMVLRVQAQVPLRE
jgi:hypothetical protein